MSDPCEYDPDRLLSATMKLSTFKNNESYMIPFAKQVPRTMFGSIYDMKKAESYQEPLVPTSEQTEQIRMRQSASESTRQRLR